MQDLNTEREKAEAFGRLLLWYPKSWREKNGEAMLGTILEYAENKGIKGPTREDKLRYCFTGMRERFFKFEPVEEVTRFWLLIALLYGLFYVFNISWSPGTQVSGSIGPFTNPSVLTFVFIALAWLCGIVNAGRTAARLAAFGFLTNATIATLGTVFEWLGPSLWAALLFACVTAIPWLKIKFP
ncbi:MAG: hypothetical protein RLZZ503_533 [Actinomycetota bacterium]|jgi:hypothetical protein